MTGKLNINRIFKSLFLVLKKFFLPSYFGFIQGHGYLSKNTLKDIRILVGMDNDEVVDNFEKKFSSLIGGGSSVSFAAGRMGFYSLMQEIGIKPGDHVVLQSSTCSVMVNAVFKIGAVPIFSDINDNTFSSSIDDIEKVITNKTKLIVLQHSFGIPCDIVPIALLAKKLKIFLLEDCALTLGSTLNGKICGNFGDAALFSTDHSKPINTVSGGLIYTNCIHLYRRMKMRQSLSDRVNRQRQKKIWHQFNLERRYCNPKKYGKLRIVQLIYSNILGLTKNVFFSNDYSSSNEIREGYPAKLPAFMALIGIYEIDKWPERQIERRKILKLFILEVEKIFGNKLPKVYTDESRYIVPLRLAWSCDKGSNIRRALSLIVDMDGVWFLRPIIATNEPLVNFGYLIGQCPVSERIGPNMVNFPCNISYDSANVLVRNIKEKIKTK